MLYQCTHILPSGQKCKAPAVSGSSLCRHHSPRKHLSETTPFVLPEFDDRRSLLHAVTEVLHAASLRRIKRSEAGTFLFGLQLVSRLMGDGVEPVVAPVHHVNRSEPESPCDLAPDPLQSETQKFYPTTYEEAEIFLAAMQSTSIEQALDEWEVKHRIQTTKPRSEPQNQLPRGPARTFSVSPIQAQLNP